MYERESGGPLSLMLLFKPKKKRRERERERAGHNTPSLPLLEYFFKRVQSVTRCPSERK